MRGTWADDGSGERGRREAAAAAGVTSDMVRPRTAEAKHVSRRRTPRHSDVADRGEEGSQWKPVRVDGKKFVVTFQQ